MSSSALIEDGPLPGESSPGLREVLPEPAIEAPDFSERLVLEPSSSKPPIKGGPSVDSILRRMQYNKSVPSPIGNIGADDRFAAMDRNETDLREQRREVARLQAESMERMRVAKELELLLKAREHLLENREALITARQVDSQPGQQISALEKALRETREALGRANNVLAEKEEMIAAFRAQIQELQASQSEAAEAKAAVDSYEGVTDSSLAEQVAFLCEREAFIEESENVLFNKAQELQEWETRLQQSEHDLANTPPATPVEEDDYEEPRAAFG